MLRMISSSIALSSILFAAAGRHASADDPDFRAEIVDSIKLGTGEDWSASATERLLQRLQSNDGRVRWAAAWALGQGPAEIIPRLRTLARESKEPQQRRPLVMALSNLVLKDSSALLALHRMSRSSDPIEDYYFREGIGRISIEQAGLRHTLLLLPDSMGLRPGDSYRPQGLTPGVTGNGTPWLHNVSWLELTLFKLGPPSVSDAPMLKELLNHKHPVTRRMAQEQIAMLGERAADFAEAVQTLLSDPDDDVCIQALHTLKRIGEITPEARQAIKKLLDDSFLLKPPPQFFGIPLIIQAPRSTELGQLALTTLVDLGVRDLSDEILAAIQSGAARTEEVETILVDALAKLTDKLPEVLVTMLSSDERRARTTAARAIAAFGPRGGKAVPALIAALRRELQSDEVDTLMTRRAIWRTFENIGTPAKEAVGILEEVLADRSHFRGWREEVESAIASCRGEETSARETDDVGLRSGTRGQRRRKIKELLAHATASSAYETRSETIRLQYVRYRAPFILSDVAASVMRDFIFDMRGAAPSRAVAIERLRSNFNDMKEANTVLIGLSNSYRYRTVYRPYISVALEALSLDKQPSQSPEAESLFPQAVLAVLNDPPDKSAFSKLAASGPAGIPFLAAFVGHPERSVHVSVCFRLRSKGALAVEATPALRKAVDGEHSKFTLMALERVNPTVHAEILNARNNSGASVE